MAYGTCSSPGVPGLCLTSYILQLMSLADGYMLQMDAADCDKLQAAHPSLQRTFDQIYQDIAALTQDMCQWDDCFRTVMTEVSQIVYSFV